MLSSVCKKSQEFSSIAEHLKDTANNSCHLVFFYLLDMCSFELLYRIPLLFRTPAMPISKRIQCLIIGSSLKGQLDFLNSVFIISKNPESKI